MAACENVGVCPLTARASRSENRTTPMPSLNSDSPAMAISRLLGTPALLSRPMTAMGSVGEISAPKTRQYDRGSDSPTRGRTTQVPRPTIAVEASVPKTASVPTCHLKFRSRLRSTCSAPAKSSSESIPCISTSEKSTPARSETSYWRSAPIPSTSRPIRTKESSSEMLMTPMAVGRPT
jgi:hypothetical protein